MTQTSQAPGNPVAQIPVPQLPALRTAGEVVAVMNQREELSRQLISAQRRREDVAKQLQRASSASEPGLRQRLAVLDTRISQLETDIFATGRQLSSAPGELLASTAPRSRTGFDALSSGQITAISIVFIAAVLAPMAMAWSRNLLRKGKAAPAPPVDRAREDRLERLELAVDTVALEIERIAEGQRFLTQVLTSGGAQPLASGNGSGSATANTQKDSGPAPIGASPLHNAR